MSTLPDRLILIGAGDLAREIAWTAGRQLAGSEGAPYVLAGFTVTAGEPVPTQLSGGGTTLHPVDDLDGALADPATVLLCAVADPRTKLSITDPLRARGARFTNVVDPSAVIAPDARMGDGVYMARLATISIGARVGNDCALNMYASVGHDVTVEDGCTISSHCDVTGRATIGRGAMLGSHAVVLPRGRVGAFAKVGAGSVVLRSAAADTSVFGVPARAI